MMKKLYLILLICLLLGCDSSAPSESIEKSNQIFVVGEAESQIGKEFILNLIKLNEKGLNQQLVQEVSILIEELEAKNILSEEEIERLEFNTPIEQIYFQHLAYDLNLDREMEHIFVLGTIDGGIQLLLVLSALEEVENQFCIVYNELLGSQFDSPTISIIEQNEKPPILCAHVKSSLGTGISHSQYTFYKFDEPYSGKIVQLDCGKQMNGTLQTETKIHSIEYIEDDIHVNYLLRSWVCPSFSTSIPVENSNAWDYNNVHVCLPEEFVVLLSDTIPISFAPSLGEKGVYSTTYNKEKLELLVTPFASEEYAKKLFYLFEDAILDNSEDASVTEAIKWMKKRFSLTK